MMSLSWHYRFMFKSTNSMVSGIFLKNILLQPLCWYWILLWTWLHVHFSVSFNLFWIFSNDINEKVQFVDNQALLLLLLSFIFKTWRSFRNAGGQPAWCIILLFDGFSCVGHLLLLTCCRSTYPSKECKDTILKRPTDVEHSYPKELSLLKVCCSIPTYFRKAPRNWQGGYLLSTIRGIFFLFENSDGV